jgi:Leucine-rich repeat (LRR) protein
MLVILVVNSRFTSFSTIMLTYKWLILALQRLPNLKRMDLSNSKNLKVTPCFEMIQNLERLDLSGCINLLEVHPSIGLLTSLVFLSLQNCSSLVSLDFGNAPRLRYLKVLRLSDCTKLENTPNLVVYQISSILIWIDVQVYPQFMNLLGLLQI